MSRGLGRRQLTILRILARARGLGLRINEIFAFPLLEGTAAERASAMSATRRALAKMRSAGLVVPRYYPHRRGQPRIWAITPAGQEELKRRAEGDALRDRRRRTAPPLRGTEQPVTGPSEVQDSSRFAEPTRRALTGAATNHPTVDGDAMVNRGFDKRKSDGVMTYEGLALVTDDRREEPGRQRKDIDG